MLLHSNSRWYQDKENSHPNKTAAQKNKKQVKLTAFTGPTKNTRSQTTKPTRSQKTVKK